MQQCAEGYADFVMEEYGKTRQSCSDAEVMVEQKVDFSRWVSGGTGTADCIILSDGTVEVIDFKYGLGIMVSADSEEHGGNPQLMCYCLGVLEMFDGIHLPCLPLMRSPGTPCEKGRRRSSYVSDLSRALRMPSAAPSMIISSFSSMPFSIRSRCFRRSSSPLCLSG